MSLQGNLADLPFEDLLEIITRRENRAVLRINNPCGVDTKAVIYLRDRELYAAYLYRITQSGTIVTVKRGEDAVHYLFNCADAQFYFDVMAEAEKVPEQNVFSSVREIFLASIFRGSNQSEKPVAIPSQTDAITILSQANYQLPTTTDNQTTKNLAQPQKNSLTDNKKSSSAKPKGNWLTSLKARLIRL